jgi:hypothetical protein
MRSHCFSQNSGKERKKEIITTVKCYYSSTWMDCVFYSVMKFAFPSHTLTSLQRPDAEVTVQ